MASKTITHAELDRVLDPAAEVPERFEALAGALLQRMDEESLELELRVSAQWTRPLSERAGSRPGTFLAQFRHDVERIELSDREDEARLARRIELARLRVDRAWKKAGLGEGDPCAEMPLIPSEDPNQPPSVALDPTGRMPESVAQRVLELHSLRLELVERNLYLVLINVERYSHTGASKVDLIQEGCVSLFRAVDGFDWRRGLLFRTYAVHWLNQAFRNYLYNHGNTVRVPVYLQKALKHINQAQVRIGDPNASVEEVAAKADLSSRLVQAALGAARSSFSLDASLSEEGEGARLRDLLTEEEGDEGPYSTRLESITLTEGLDRAMEKLGERESLVLQMRFGIGNQREHTLAEVARHLGVSVERVRQIQVRALSKLKTPGLRRVLDPWLN